MGLPARSSGCGEGCTGIKRGVGVLREGVVYDQLDGHRRSGWGLEGGGVWRSEKGGYED